jgi:hypothetical protein
MVYSRNDSNSRSNRSRSRSRNNERHGKGQGRRNSDQSGGDRDGYRSDQRYHAEHKKVDYRPS